MWVLLVEGTAVQRKARGECMFGEWPEHKTEKSKGSGGRGIWS